MFGILHLWHSVLQVAHIVWQIAGGHGIPLGHTRAAHTSSDSPSGSKSSYA